MADFFLFQTELPPDVGFRLFGRFHLALLLLLGLLSCCTRYARAWSSSTQTAFSHTLTGIMALSELVRLSVLAVTGNLTVSVLPLHLCSLAVWLCVIYARCPIGWIGQTLYTLCLPGALSALLFPDWTFYPPWNYFCLHGFFIHAATVLWVLVQLQTGRIRPTWKAVYQPIAFLGALVPFLLWFNRKFHTNYLFVCNASPGSPLVLLGAFPLGYLCGYLLLLLCLILVMLSVWSLSHLRKKPRIP
ncbi:MAG: YwaF family protein [Eubacteriales bacterium]|nr:YwaF family protein [Eubacteriales bacterium]